MKKNQSQETDLVTDLAKELEELQQEHSELDDIIDNQDSIRQFSLFTLQQFKKRKLLIRDKINILKSRIYPDIIA